jgi:hypothetical protein
MQGFGEKVAQQPQMSAYFAILGQDVQVAIARKPKSGLRFHEQSVSGA